SAGALRSPQLLMLSGIGPPDQLRRVGVGGAHELPLVGRELTDHASGTVPFRVSRRRNPVPRPTESAGAHMALHCTTAGSAECSDMMLIQSCIPVNQTVVHGLPLAAQWDLLKATAGKLSAAKLLDYLRYGWDQAITCIMQQDESRGEIRF